MADRVVKFSQFANFFPRQMEALKLANGHRYFLYGGCRGPGKSYFLRKYLIYRLLRWAKLGFRGVRVGMFCETYPDLTERQITKIAGFPAWLGRVKETRADGLCFFLRPCFGGGKIALRNLDDPTKYQSAEFAGIAIDELTKNEERVFDELRGSLRWPGIADCFFVAASNPNGVGQQWVREYFVEKNLPENLADQSGEFCYLAARPDDNVHLDASYWKMLDSLPEALRRAWRDGDWYVSFEGVVFPEFGAENIVDCEPEPGLPIELAVDDGYIDPRAILFVQRTGSGVLVFDEIYESGVLAEAHILRVLERCRERGWGNPDLVTTGSEAAELRAVFRKHNLVARGELSKLVDRLGLLRRMVVDGNGVRSLKVHHRCRNLVWELTQGYRYPEKGRFSDHEKPLDGNDHAVEALGNWMWMRCRRM